MIKIIAHHYLKPGSRAALDPLYKELVSKVRAEEGNLEYDLFEDKDDENHLVFIESYGNMDDIKAHTSSEHYTTIVPKVKDYQEKPTEVLILKQYL